MEKRSFTRVAFESEAFVVASTQCVKGEIKDLSLMGMFLKTQEKLPVDSPVEVKISLSGTSSELLLKIDGVVMRQTDEGMAIQFNGMSLDSFIHLKNIISYNQGDDEQVRKEFFDFMKFNRQDLGPDEGKEGI